jgi:acetoin utilization deacetylase AcuC-like enzyme
VNPSISTTINKAPGVLFDRRYFEHSISQISLENAGRVRNLYHVLETNQYAERLSTFRAREASHSDIEAVHSSFYLEQLREHVNVENPYSYDRDTYLMEQSLYTAGLAAGGCLELADRIINGEINYGFALIRPPGHHAEPGRGMGFCIFNNVAITAQYLRRVYGLQRILVVDFDVHHGNGTQSVFWESEQVFFLSIHQEKLFPFTGDSREVGGEQGQGYTINLPVYPQFGDQEYLFLLSRVLSGVVEQYLPQIILVSAGFDGHHQDPISRIQLTTEWYGVVTELLKFLAHEACGDRLLFILEGGYNPVSLEASVLAVMDRLLCPPGKRPGVAYSERAAKILAQHPLHAFWTL